MIGIQVWKPSEPIIETAIRPGNEVHEPVAPVADAHHDEGDRAEVRGREAHRQRGDERRQEAGDLPRRRQEAHLVGLEIQGLDEEVVLDRSVDAVGELVAEDGDREHQEGATAKQASLLP